MPGALQSSVVLPSPPPPPPRATAGRVIGAASQQRRALFYRLLSYLIHLIKLADPAVRENHHPLLSINPLHRPFPFPLFPSNFTRDANSTQDTWRGKGECQVYGCQQLQTINSCTFQTASLSLISSHYCYRQPLFHQINIITFEFA